MTTGVVILLEIIDIDDQHGKIVFVPLGAGHLIVQSFHQVFAIIQSSQTISYGELVEFLVFLAESLVDGSQFFSPLTQPCHHVVEDLSKVPHLTTTENGKIHLQIARGHLRSTPGETI